MMRKALLVGINDYEWAPLLGCINDANKMTTVLKKHYNDNDNFYCNTYTSDKTKITKATLMGAIKELFSADAEMALFYFSGHGFKNDLGGILVTQDAVQHSEGVTVSDIITLANKANHIKQVVIILDCCYANHMGTISAIDDGKALLREGISILTSSLSNEPSVESKSKKQGLFTSILLEAFEGGAADIFGHVTAGSLYNYTSQILGPWQQTPSFKNNISKITPLRFCKPKIAADDLNKMTHYFPTEDYKYPLDTSYDNELEPKNEAHELIMKDFRSYKASGLLMPLEHQYLYKAAQHSTGCELTPLGKFYWKVLSKNSKSNTKRFINEGY